MRKKNLEIILQELHDFTNPKVEFEQYTTPGRVAAEILFMAYRMGDIVGNKVADFGAGPGIFSIGACILNAEKVYAVELDGDAIEDLKSNINKEHCERIEICHEGVEKFGNHVNTVFQNTPFGSQRRHADIPFLNQALKTGDVVYTLHNSKTRDFLAKKIKEMGGKITHIAEFEFYINRIYSFHRKERIKRKFVFFRIETGENNLK